MTPEAVIDVLVRSIWATIEISTPLLMIGLVVGLVMGLVQAATQISEPALTFVPKLAALAIGMVLFGPWMLERITMFSREMFEAVADAGK